MLPEEIGLLLAWATLSPDQKKETLALISGLKSARQGHEDRSENRQGQTGQV